MILALDSGGSKTKIIGALDSGDILFTDVTKGYGLALDDETVLLTDLTDYINKSVENPDEVTNIVMNMGGRNSGQLRNTLKTAYPNAEIDIFRESSGFLGEQIRLANGCDIIIFAGTGTIAQGYGNGGWFVSDGWGRDVGDGGSGYSIGLEAIRASLMALEGSEPLTPIVKHITGENELFGVVSTSDGLLLRRDAIRNRILPLERGLVASFAKAAADFAREGDKVALEIYENAGASLANTAIRISKKCRLLENIRIAVVGGIANSRDLWQKGFDKQFKQYAPQFELVFPEMDFALAALDYAIKKQGDR